ncbi:MAG: PEGA domain-containing protein, partial [Myxococcota bacterium]
MGWVRLSLVAVVLAGRGWAEQDAVVAVGDCQSGSAAALARSLRAALRERPGSKVQSEEETALRLGGLSRSSLAEVERLLAGARYELFDQAAYDRAERALTTALEDLWRLPPTEERWRDVREVRTLLASIFLKTERKREAERELEALLRVEPEYRPDANLYPPSMRKFAEGVAGRLRREPSHALSVVTLPPGLPVLVEGKPLGSAPQTVRLPAGEYWVEASFGGRRGLPKKVRLPTRATVELDAGFEGAVYADVGPCLATGGSREERLAAVVRLAALLGVAQVVAVRVEEPAGEGRYEVASMVDASSGQEVREAKVKVVPGGSPAGAMPRLAAFLATGEVLPPVEAIKGAEKVVASAPVPARVEIQQPVPANRSGLRTASFVVAGAGVAALAGGGYLLLQAGRQNEQMTALCPESTCLPDSLAEFDRLERARGSSSSTGTVLVAAGGAALVTGVVLYMVSGRD